MTVHRMIVRTKIQNWGLLSLITGGILILAGSLVGSLLMGLASGGNDLRMSGMVHANLNDGWRLMMPFWMVIVGIFAGRIVLLAAFHVHTKRQTASWSIAAIVVGALSLLIVGGYVIGAVAAIAGGALALVGTLHTQAAREG